MREFESFSSGRSHLIAELRVESFRGLSNVELSNLRRVNLLVGSGNSGKTSVLEALVVFSNPLAIATWMEIWRSRELRLSYFNDTGGEALKWLFPHLPSDSEGTDTHNPIIIYGEGRTNVKKVSAVVYNITGQTTQVTTSLDEDGEPQDEEEVVEDEGIAIDISTNWGDAHLFDPSGHKEIRVVHKVWRIGGLEYPRFRGPTSIRSEYLPPYAHRNQPAQLRSLTQAIVDDEQRAINALMQDLDPNIISVEIISDKQGRKPIIAIRHRQVGLAPLSVFGDGLRRSLMIALALHKARGGILLIDEIEAALHVSALSKVFPWILKSCIEHDVQLFASTHSLEALDAICAWLDDETAEEVAAYHLAGGSDQVGLKRYSGPVLKRLVHERGLDIR